jgi:hypothetical protein
MEPGEERRGDIPDMALRGFRPCYVDPEGE